MDRQDDGTAASREGGHFGEGHGAGCGAGEDDQQIIDQRKLNDRMGRIAHKVLVLSGKGGVGKSTVAVNLAVSLMLQGKRVGLLDVDIHGPSVPKMLGLEGQTIHTEGETMLPVELGDLKVMSIGFLLHNQDDALIWRGPMKMAVIKQFLMDVDWGDLDYLVIDAPPGTGDEPLSICQLIENADGAVVVTTPQEVALAAVRKSITFCCKLSLPVLGVVENMSGFVCPHCGERIEIFETGGGERLAKEMKVPFLGRIPIEPEVAASGDAGLPYIQKYPDTATGKAFAGVIRPILAGGPHFASSRALATGAPIDEHKERNMRIAVPMAAGKLSQHFGHCERFALLDVDEAAKTILGKQELESPEHEPGLLPRWLAEKGATLIIAGGMGASAQKLFAESGIQVVIGAPVETPEALVASFMSGTLQTGGNLCDH
jgi:Mrp family chromosome partitioning ATPase/predicted Fe-Mo cluster-binding NifX family protein